jgi:pyruvate formate lyase activating enzyme
MERLEVDRPYYDSSGGGVTFTGGEPTIHHRFLADVLERCRRSGIRTNLETAGTFSWERWSETLRLLDLIYFDLKILDAELHERHLGAGFDRIMENAKSLVDGDYPVEFRMALIPGFTDTQDNIDAVVDLLHALGRPSIHLLPYHNMGEVKIDIIRGNQPKLGLDRYPDDRFAEMRSTFERRGIEVLTAS